MAKTKSVDVQALQDIITAQSATIKLLTETIESLRKSTGAGAGWCVLPTPSPTVGPYIPYIGDWDLGRGHGTFCGGASSGGSLLTAVAGGGMQARAAPD